VSFLKRVWLMAGGAAFALASEDFAKGRFWPWVLDLAVIAVALYVSKPSKGDE
jgi:hypothetical protein